MNRKNFMAAAAAALALTFGLVNAPEAEANGKGKQKGPTLVDVAIAVNSSGPYAGQFDTLIAAVLAADPAVLQRLSAKRQSTVFAPTDGAFEALGLTPANIGDFDEGALTQILLYHVVNGRRDANDVLASTQLRTLQGSFLKQSAGRLTDNLGREATIIVTDVPAANGIIHAIDAVVLPFAP
ncbi:MAG: fasciclin domain-containing protein [Steroidobacteraceae bacterium]|nr:fasciclin domain-containing protein [Steroidobacteraceae bacterium]